MSERLKGEERRRVAASLAGEYAAGASIRALAADADLSYGKTRALLLEAGMKLRARGGPRKTKVDR